MVDPQALLDPVKMAELLRRRVAGETFPDSFIREADPYSAAPEDLVHGAPGQGNGAAWYFCWPAECHGSTSRRKRKVAALGDTYWHPETGKQAIIASATGGESVGAYKRTLSYVCKIRNPSGNFTRKRLGWCMIEVGLDGLGQGLVLCRLYRPHLPRAGVPCPELAPVPLATETPIRRVAIVRDGSVAGAGAGAAVTVVIDLCGLSMPPAQWLKGMAYFVRDLETPAVLVSAMGNTTTTILLAAWKALRCGPEKVCQIHELLLIKEMYLRTTHELGLETSTASGSLDLLEHQLQHVAMTKKMTPWTLDYLVSFGEITSTKIFCEYLNKLEGTLQVWKLHTIATSGARTDFTPNTTGRALESREIQVWKDVDGIFRCDPKVCEHATLVPHLTFDEAAELGDFAEQSMKHAMENGIPVRIRNPYKLQVPGTVITRTRDMSESALTIVVLKSNITMLDIKSKRMLDQSDFVATAFSKFKQFEYLGIYVDCKFTISGNMSLSLVPSEPLSEESIKLELDNLVEELQEIAEVDRLENVSVISMIGNAHMSLYIHEKALSTLWSIKAEVHKFSQDLSKVMKAFLVVDKSRAKDCVQALHSAFFGMGLVSEVGGAENVPQVPVYSPQVPAYISDVNSSVPQSVDDQLFSNECLADLMGGIHKRMLVGVDTGACDSRLAVEEPYVDEEYMRYNGAYGSSVPTVPKACPAPRPNSPPCGHADGPVDCTVEDQVVPDFIENMGVEATHCVWS